MNVEFGVDRIDPVVVPRYLTETYWWAYVHPAAVRLFERQWLVNVILCGNFGRLRDAALDALGPVSGAKVLQIACVYGDLTKRLAGRLGQGASLEVIDVLPIQLSNLGRKLGSASKVSLRLVDSTAIDASDRSYDRALMFFLLHEQPADVRKASLREAIRVLRPGGRLVIVDYHKPRAFHPMTPVLRQILARFEPFALDLWHSEIVDWLPAEARAMKVTKRVFFGGLYQLVTIEC